jgi:hypothetical protein
MLLLRHASSLAVRTALQNAVAALNHAKVPEAQASAEWLLAHALGESDRTSVQTAIATKGVLDTEQQAQFSAFVERRLQREPVQYIVGKWAFHDIELELEPPTLIPRSGRGVRPFDLCGAATAWRPARAPPTPSPRLVAAMAWRAWRVPHAPSR